MKSLGIFLVCVAPAAAAACGSPKRPTRPADDIVRAGAATFEQGSARATMTMTMEMRGLGPVTSVGSGVIDFDASAAA